MKEEINHEVTNDYLDDGAGTQTGAPYYKERSKWDVVWLLVAVVTILSVALIINAKYL